MRQLVSQKETHEQAIAAFRKRIDIGLLNGLASSALEPSNPFQDKEKRLRCPKMSHNASLFTRVPDPNREIPRTAGQIGELSRAE